MSSVHEEWRPVVGYEGRYEVSSLGRLRSYVSYGATANNPNLLRIFVGGGGYCQVTLTAYSGAQAGRHVHRLVAEAFIPNPQGLPVVRHLNHDKGDNRAENLAWGTYRDNTRDSRRDGRLVTGERSHRALLTEEQVYEIRADRRSHRVIAEEYGVKRVTISAIKSRRTWRDLPPRWDDATQDVP